MRRLITEEIFQAFLKCETKSHLQAPGAVGTECEFADWQRCLVEDFKRKGCIQLRSNLREDECLSGTFPSEGLESSKYCLVTDCVVQVQEIQSHIHALERLPSAAKTKHSPYIPIRFVPSEKITSHDKLLIAFDALAMFTASGKMPLFGKIIHGSEQKAVKVQLAGLMKTAQSIVERIVAQQANPTPPQLVLNRHCSVCAFRPRGRQIAEKNDDLSLLSSMNEKERKKQHDKGIFSVTQLSYTFRPRRKLKRSASKPYIYSHALKALAIREQKIHIAGSPQLNKDRNLVYLDVEGIPDRDFYYLIGLRIKSGDVYVQYSFWADDLSEEKEMWASFIRTLARIENPQLIHYGSYETIFLKRMKERYRVAVENTDFIDQLIAEAVNLLSVIYAQIYFPTYSNGLKEIAQYLGFQWSDSNASGLNSLMWRDRWEFSKDSNLKQRLVTYNAEDCEALERAANVIAQLCQKQIGAEKLSIDDIVDTNSLKQKSSYRFGNNVFSMPELKQINQSAYWDYQRDKIYVRSSPRLKRISKKVVISRAKALPVNKVIICQPPTCCPECKATKLYKHGRLSKVVRDLKFSRTSIKRWVVKYYFNRFICCACGATCYSQQYHRTTNKHGLDLLSYLVYQIIELRIPQSTVTESLNQFFKLNLDRATVNRQKTRAAQLYKDCYEEILRKVVSGRLVHADETKISIEGRSAFVWALTNLEEVIYFYTETREGDVVQSLLQDFKGVLVSDFYAAYDSINCPQQKCLIHLMRDLNDDLLRQPFNEELKELVREFAGLLKPMIETVDRFGLKAHYLGKHKVFVESFYKRLIKSGYESEIAGKYKKRFEKNRDRLFTFLNHDGIPWNNNNAEHAIKAFAMLRNVIRGTSSAKGIREYLTLLSVCETCKYKGANFLDFLRSGEKDIDEFIEKGKHAGNQRFTQSQIIIEQAE
ncbi:MAG: IS66 family transposase [Acidobacteriota bacterium]|nr:IS66 family transposase [Acidobacteriota bacterium]